MNFLKANLKSILIILLGLCSILGLYFYNSKQDALSLAEQSQWVTGQMHTTSTMMTQIRQAQSAGVEFTDSDVDMDSSMELLEEEYKLLTEWDKALQDGQSDTAAYYSQYLSSLREQPIVWIWVRQYNPLEMEVNYKKAQYLEDNNFSYIEESYPIDSALFIEQLSGYLFNGLTLFIFLIFFGFELFTLKASGLIDLYLTQPITNRKI